MEGGKLPHPKPSPFLSNGRALSRLFLRGAPRGGPEYPQPHSGLPCSALIARLRAQASPNDGPKRGTSKKWRSSRSATHDDLRPRSNGPRGRGVQGSWCHLADNSTFLGDAGSKSERHPRSDLVCWVLDGAHATKQPQLVRQGCFPFPHLPGGLLLTVLVNGAQA